MSPREIGKTVAALQNKCEALEMLIMALAKQVDELKAKNMKTIHLPKKDPA